MITSLFFGPSVALGGMSKYSDGISLSDHATAHLGIVRITMDCPDQKIWRSHSCETCQVWNCKVGISFYEPCLSRSSFLNQGVLRHYKKRSPAWLAPMTEEEKITGPLACFGRPIWQLERTTDLWILLEFHVQSFYIDSIIGVTLASAFDQFNFIDAIGQGGFGSIYLGTKKLVLKNVEKAIHPELALRTCPNSKRWKKKLDGLWDFPVAFKVISSNQDERFIREEIESLIHARGIKGIPTLYDVFFDPQDGEITVIPTHSLVHSSACSFHMT